jgi:hypothetical protein
MSGLVVDGDLEQVIVNTAGLRWQDYWMVQLREKYGEPSSLRDVDKENGFGAVFASHVAIWQFANLRVEFQGTGDSTDTGTTVVATTKGLAFLDSTRRVDHPMPQVGPRL